MFNKLLRQWWRSLQGPKTYAVFSKNDPMPFIIDIRDKLGELARRAASSLIRSWKGKFRRNEKPAA